MSRNIHEFIPDLPEGCVVKAVCFLASIAVLLASIAAAFIQLFAYMNMHFGNTPHLLIFAVGWGIIVTCLWCGFSFVRTPSWRRLTRLLVAIPLLALFFWLYSQPFASGLMH